MGFSAGMMIGFAGGTPPSGWAVCNGAAISRSEYPETYAAIGTTWGVGDGSTTFNLPDFRGRTIVGVGTGSGLSPRTLGDYFGAEEVTLTVGELPSHSHAEKTNDNREAYIKGGTGSYGYGIEGGANAPLSNGRILTSETGSGEAHDNIQPSGSSNIIIKLEDEVATEPEGMLIDATQWQALIDALTEA